MSETEQSADSEAPFTVPKKIWHRNLIALWVGLFLTSMGFSELMPFLSLYIETLGNYTHSELSLYSGLAFSASFIVAAVVSPLWGSLADRYGRRLMLLRASLGMTICVLLMGFATNVWMIIGLRFIQGIFSGYMPNSNALLAIQVPKKESGKALGILSTGGVSGALFGPFLGGILASVFSYRVTFFITGSLMLVVFFVTLFFVKEKFQPVAKEDNLHTKEVIHVLPHPKLIFGMFVTTMIIQASNNSISPILSLYVKQIMHGSPTVTFFSGVVAAVPGISTLVAAPRLGAIGDRIGSEKIMIFGFILAIFLYVPMAFVTNVWELMILRFLLGVSNACMLPAVQAIIAKNTPAQVTGRIFSWNQSFQAVGNFSGPMIGSVVSSIFGYSGVFISTSILVFLNLCLVLNDTKALRRTHQA
ncbi:multidrug efflux MFS transporter [Fructilactobacillus carniphilus]|uniref:Multidrug efflux MFS transporter n=1 Tax=Fructilactobacillus carniphilus TaxID=2940297 RepID=A0ABY5BUY2_9LACO|nr:multidrug efflux MFS transporter [Fructilactobacillus carniphilus]USS90147.1 multidrug efflux MFS transporter [Fructilactobacillus carniphilus]